MVEQPTSGAPFVSMRAIGKVFPGVVALHDVSLDIAAGEVVALTGENGSGKSTLAKVLSGIHQPDAGTVTIDGQTVRIPHPADALARGIVTISQELTLAPTLTVAENIFLGRLPRRRGSVDWATCRARAREILDDLGVHVDETTPVSALSVELQQEVEIARAVSTRARLLILDEATSSLSEAATDRLLDIVGDMSARGVAVLMISHRMPELYRAASRASVLRDGRLVDTVPLPETPESQLVRLMVGRDLQDYYGNRSRRPGEVVLRVDSLSTPDGRLRSTSFTVRRGEIVGVAGLVGSGKAELGLALGGAIRSEGTAEVAGRRVSLRSPRTAIAGGIGFVPDERKTQAILATRSVSENFALAWLRQICRVGVIRSRAQRAMVHDAISRYGVVAATENVKIPTLSGGNQQKVVLGRTFVRGSDVFVLSEPTRGIDVGSKSAIYTLLQDIVERGAAVVLISSELPELLGMSDRILVFHRGAVRAEFDATRCDEAAVAAVAVSGTSEDTLDASARDHLPTSQHVSTSRQER